MDEQNWERGRSGETVEDRFEGVNVDPLINIDDNGRRAQIEGINEGAKFTCNCRRLPFVKRRVNRSFPRSRADRKG